MKMITIYDDINHEIYETKDEIIFHPESPEIPIRIMDLLPTDKFGRYEVHLKKGNDIRVYMLVLDFNIKEYPY